MPHKDLEKRKRCNKEWAIKNTNKIKQYKREWYYRNKEKELAKAKQREKNMEERKKAREYSRKWYYSNKERAQANHRKWKQENKDKVKEYNRKYAKVYIQENKLLIKGKKKAKRDECKENNPITLRKYTLKKYGISIEEYGLMYSKQNGFCAICHKPEINKRSITNALCIDHDHQTNKIRGLLCNKCNKALGLFGDNVSILKEAIKYLEGF